MAGAVFGDVAMPLSWQAHHLVMLQCHFLGQARFLVMLECHF